MAGPQVKPCPRNPQPAQSLQSMACQTATAKGWQYGPLDAKNSQQQIPTSWNGVASPPTHGPAGMASKTSSRWGDCRPAVYVRQQLEHHSYLPPLPTGPAHPTGLVVQRQNQGENGWVTWYGASPATVGGTSWPQQGQQSSQTTALCLPGESNQMPQSLMSGPAGANRIPAGDQAKIKPGPAARPTRAAYPHQRAMMSIWRTGNRQSNQPHTKFKPPPVTHDNGADKNQASRVPNRTDRISKVPFSQGRRFNQAGPRTTFPADLERVVMELPPIRECFPDVFGNIDCASANR